MTADSQACTESPTLVHGARAGHIQELNGMLFGTCMFCWLPIHSHSDRWVSENLDFTIREEP